MADEGDLSPLAREFNERRSNPVASARAAQAARRQTVLGFADGGRRRFVTAGSGVQRKTFKPCAVWGPCCASLRSTPPEH